MTRSLREIFVFAGCKKRIFHLLENVIHILFFFRKKLKQTFIDSTPELFNSQKVRDRGNKNDEIPLAILR